MIVFWIIVFLAALVVMVKGADWFLESAESLGLSLGMSPFVVGIVIVGLGTSLPELISSFAAILQGATEIVTANAVGSNIANILLVIGLSAIAGGRLVVTKNLIDLDLPLFALATALFLGTAWDGTITTPESLFLVIAYGIYIAYTFLYKDDDDGYEAGTADILPDRSERRGHKTKRSSRANARREGIKLGLAGIGKLLFGLAGLILGAKYLIESVVVMSDILAIGAGTIALFAVALGTSLPEILVSIKAALQKKSEIALGNIFGSNVFNILAVVGVPGLFTNLAIETQTLMLGLPVLMVATALFVISGISKRIHIWEGCLYVLIYLFFIGKLFGLF